MFKHASREIVCYADVERAVPAAGENIHEEKRVQGNGSTKSSKLKIRSMKLYRLIFSKHIVPLRATRSGVRPTIDDVARIDDVAHHR